MSTISEAAKRAAMDIYHHRESGAVQWEETPVLEIIQSAIDSETAILERELEAMTKEMEICDDAAKRLHAERDALRQQLAAVTAKLSEIDAFLYGQPLAYEPDRVETLQTIRKIGEGHRNKLTAERDAALSACAEKDEALKAFVKAVTTVEFFFMVGGKATPELQEAGRLSKLALSSTCGQSILDAKHHMDACRALLNAPDDDVLYSSIKAILDELEKLRKLNMEEYTEAGWNRAKEVGVERDAILRERDSWKAAHDNQVKLRRVLMDRPDLQDRAASIQVLITERDQLTSLAADRLKALTDLMPFVLDEYYPDCATPKFKRAVEAAMSAAGIKP